MHGAISARGPIAVAARNATTTSNKALAVVIVAAAFATAVFGSDSARERFRVSPSRSAGGGAFDGSHCRHRRASPRWNRGSDRTRSPESQDEAHNGRGGPVPSLGH